MAEARRVLEQLAPDVELDERLLRRSGDPGHGLAAPEETLEAALEATPS